MYGTNIDPTLSKSDFYAELLTQVKVIIDAERNWVTNLANVCSLIYHGMNSLNIFREKPINWVGFYVGDRSDSTLLRLGPFQGKVACSQIRVGKGVCGTTAATGQTQVVFDVHKFPGHIACDSGSNSEIVVPIVTVDGSKNNVIGVLDIDCLVTGGFDLEDKAGLEPICEVIAQGCDWNC